MKRLASVIMIAFVIAFSFSGCSKKRIDPVKGEIRKNGDKFSVSFTVRNSTGEKIDGLTLKIKTFTESGEEADSGEAAYPIEIEDGAEATLTFSTDKECSSAQAVSYSYKTSGVKTVQGEFSDFKAAVAADKVEDALTREALAEEIIRDVRNQFLAKDTYSHGTYDAEKKHLIIVSDYKQSYDVCLALYEKDPDIWKSLTDGIISMSETCLEEFRNNNFDDVSVSIGVMSSDEEIMFSATNGELTESLGQNIQN